ncbi:outer membrane protein [Qipengyuania sp. DGS5-3]|uniref:outer membrane protein n=1 Tax=Qipengyuania sp. DGS5-3 TaxID=3349632 RepID=UPI0036D295FD
MKYVAISGAAFALCMPSLALAQDDDSGPYIGLSGGLVLPGDSSNSGEFDADVPATEDFGEIPAETPLGWETDFDNGFAISGQAGYKLSNGFRVELQGDYNEYDVGTHTGLTVGETDIDASDVAILTRGAADDANPTVGAVIADGQGQVKNFGLFTNAFYDLNRGGTIQPYVGAGVGYQWTDVEFSPSGVDVADDDDGAFAYQLMAGASVAVSESFDLFAQYTYRDTFGDADIPLNLVPATLGVETQQSILSAGVRLKLGG